MKEEIFESHEALAKLVRKRKQRKRILAFVLAVTMLVTFAIPISIPVQNPAAGTDTDDGMKAPLYSADAEI